jgi:pimeloyl-ACP methyl ester carboxylesterase
MPTASNGSVSLAYERRGPATADTVAFVEGLGFGRWMWRWQARALADGYGVLLWDNRGTGASDEPETYDEREAMSYRMEPALSDGFAEANPELFENILE